MVQKVRVISLNLMPKYFKYFFWILLASPFLAFFIRTRLNLVPYYFFGSISSLLAFLFVFTKKFKTPKYVTSLVFLLLYYFIWDLFNGRLDDVGLVRYLFKNLTLHTIAILIIINSIYFSPSFIRIIVKVFKALIVLSLVFTLYQLIFNPLFFNVELQSDKLSAIDYFEIRNTSLWGYLSLLDVGLTLVPIVALVIGYSVINNENYLIWLIFGTIIAFGTNSRWTMINILFVYTIIIIGKKRRVSIKKIFKYVMAVIIGLLILLKTLDFAGYNLIEYMDKRILSQTAETRIVSAGLFKEHFVRNPIFGTGERVTKALEDDLQGRSSQIHIGYLSHAFQYGLIGSSLFFLFLIRITSTFYKNAKRSNFYGSFIGFVCFLLANISLVEYSIFHFGLIFCFVFDRFYLTHESTPFKQA